MFNSVGADLNISMSEGLFLNIYVFKVNKSDFKPTRGDKLKKAKETLQCSHF